jgi:hypothetical protein
MIYFYGGGTVFMAISYLLYLVAILELAGKDMPPNWSAKLGELHFYEIYEKIGPPQDDASAKQYQNWIEYHWWGTKMLKISASQCCKPSAQPSEIYYIVYAKGKYAPIHSEILFRSAN